MFSAAYKDSDIRPYMAHCSVIVYVRRSSVQGPRDGISMINWWWFQPIAGLNVYPIAQWPGANKTASWASGLLQNFLIISGEFILKNFAKWASKIFGCMKPCIDHWGLGPIWCKYLLAICRDDHNEDKTVLKLFLLITRITILKVESL